MSEPRKQQVPETQRAAAAGAAPRAHVPPGVTGSAANAMLGLQRTAGNRAVTTALASTGASASAVPDGGQPLPGSLRDEMEDRFGHDFGHVRVHTGGAADAASRAERAAAYTIGRNIVFRAGRFEPSSPAGKGLLAHELAHVIQQGRGGHLASAVHEAEARSAAQSVSSGETPSVTAAAPVAIQRRDDDEVPSTPAANARKIEPRPTTNAAAAAQAADEFHAKYPTKLDPGEGGRGLREAFSRTGNLSTPGLRRGASPELATLTSLLDDDRVARVRMIPSSSEQRTFDFLVEYADGRPPDRFEITAVTSAPGPGRTTVRPTDFAEGKTSRGGLVTKTQERLPDIDKVKSALNRKAVGPGLQLSVPFRDIPAGGRVVIDLPFGSSDPAMLHQAMTDMAERIHGDVRAVTFVTRTRNEAGALTRQYVTFERSGARAFTALPPSASLLGPRAVPAAGAIAGGGNAAARVAGEGLVASAGAAGTKEAEKAFESDIAAAVESTATRRAARAGEKGAGEIAVNFLRRRAEAAAAKRGGSLVPVLGWAFAFSDIHTGIRDVTHGDVALGAATIAVAVIDAESDALHLGDAVTGVGGTALSLTVQSWATAMQIGLNQSRVSARSAELREFIQNGKALPPGRDLEADYGLNDEEIMILNNEISGFGRKQVATAAMVCDETELRIAEIDRQLTEGKLDATTTANLAAARQRLADDLLPFFKIQAYKEEQARQQEIAAKKTADLRAWQKRQRDAAARQAAPKAPAPPAEQALLRPPGAPVAPAQYEPIPGMSTMGDHSDPAGDVIASAGHWTSDLLERGRVLQEKSHRGARPDDKARRAYAAELKKWREVMTDARRFYPRLADLHEMERKLRDLNGEFGPELDRIAGEL